MDKVSELMFSKAPPACSVPGAIQHGGNHLSQDLEACRPPSWEAVGRELFHRNGESPRAIIDPGPGGWTCLSNCQLGLFPTEGPLLFRAVHLRVFQRELPPLLLNLQTLLWGFFSLPVNLNLPLFRLFPRPLFWPLQHNHNLKNVIFAQNILSNPAKILPEIFIWLTMPPSSGSWIWVYLPWLLWHF